MDLSNFNFGTVHYHFKGYQDENIKLVSQQYRDWPDFTDVQAGLALFWWQRHLVPAVGGLSNVKRTKKH
jgi:hypothetical protein